jgi:hypothetical protein
MSGKCTRRTRSSAPAVVTRIDCLSSLFALMPAEYVNGTDECQPGKRTGGLFGRGERTNEIDRW